MKTSLILVVCTLALGGYFFFRDSAVPVVTPTPDLSGSNQARQVPAGMREYKNDLYKFSLFYPDALSVKEFNEGSGAMTVTFQNTEQGSGFQVFILPYADLQISEERFKKDIPSGVRTNVEEVVVDGANGAAFYSRDVFLGETREVWFIRNGFLFEVTTIKPLEADVLHMLGTWAFI